jgi:hypothetical protein
VGVSETESRGIGVLTTLIKEAGEHVDEALAEEAEESTKRGMFQASPTLIVVGCEELVNETCPRDAEIVMLVGELSIRLASIHRCSWDEAYFS